MTRSPYINTLRQAYWTTQLSGSSKILTDEVIGMLGEKSNRNLHKYYSYLKSGNFKSYQKQGSLSVGSNNQDTVVASRQSPILIVGAGIAGLTAAYRLRQAGVPIDIVEATNRVGGRVQSLPNAAGTLLTAEVGAEFIDSDHTYLLSLATELGLNLLDRSIAYQGLTPTIFFFQGHRVSTEEINREFLPVAQQIVKDLEILKDFQNYRVFHQPTVELDQLSLTEYLDRLDISPIIRHLIEIAYIVEFGREAEEQSCLNLLYLIGTQPEQLHLLGACDERYYVDGGNEQIPRKLADSLANSIETNTALEALRSLADGRYQVTLHSGHGTHVRNYERILLTVPFSVLRKIDLKVDLPPQKRLAINTLGYGSNTKLTIGYGERIWRTHYRSNAYLFSDLEFQNIWESDPNHNPYDGMGLLTNFTGGDKSIELETASSKFHAQRLTQQLEPVFPGIEAIRLKDQAVLSNWLSKPYTRGSYACYLVGQWSQMYGVEQERVGNLFFAGEHCSVDYQACMEGACKTGEIAAGEILADLGLTAVATQQSAQLSNDAIGNPSLREQFPFQRL